MTQLIITFDVMLKIALKALTVCFVLFTTDKYNLLCYAIYIISDLTLNIKFTFRKSRIHLLFSH